MESDSPTMLVKRQTMVMNENMSMGVTSVFWFPKLYWIFVGSIIAGFFLINLLNQALFRQRIFAARSGKAQPARPRTLFWSSFATLTAVTREVSNFAGHSRTLGPFNVYSPSFGAVLLVLGNAILVVLLCLYALDLSDLLQYQNIGYRCGFVSLAQIPFIFALAGKNNVIGWLTGTSYERLNWLHRWVARTLLITTTLHMSYWFLDWAPYDFITTQIRNDPTTQRGLISWAILLWIVISSVAPIRNWSYEIFVIQHAISYVAFMTMIFMHVPSSDYVFLWAPLALFFFDRVVRGIYVVYTNVSLFHPKQKREGNFSGLWACRAQLTPLAFDATRVTIHNPPISWQPGQHAFLSCHSLLPLQSHPFTISTLAEDGKLEFIVRARRGATRRLFAYAEKQLGLPSIHHDTPHLKTMPVAIEGPYGRMRPLQQFDTVVLFAGSTGATFTVPLLRNIVRQWANMSMTTPDCKPGLLESLRGPSGAATRRVTFIWAIKSTDQLAWFAPELAQVADDVAALRKQGLDVDCDIRIHITRDERFTGEFNDENNPQPYHAPPAARSELTRTNSSSNASTISSMDAEKDSLKPSGPAETIAVNEIHPPAETSSMSFQHQRDTSHQQPASSSSSVHSSSSSQKALLRIVAPHDAVSLHSGRPSPRGVVRAALEAAQGESGVVSCGPRTLNDECRRAVVALSDERAVCKGTGALAVWYHGEGFGYA